MGELYRVLAGVPKLLDAFSQQVGLQDTGICHCPNHDAWKE